MAKSPDAAVRWREIDIPGLGAIRISIFDRIDAIEACWRLLQTEGTSSAYQRFEWVHRWTDTLGKASGLSPRFILATRGDAPLFILPWSVSTRLGARIAGWLADSHTNFRMGLFSSSFLEAATPAVISEILRTLGELLGGVDAIVLSSQPRYWGGRENPFALLPAQASNNPAFALNIEGGFADALKRINGSKRRKKHRWQMNQLGDSDRLSFRRATSVAEVETDLDIAFGQMAVRFETIGVRDAFADPETRTFFRSLAIESLEDEDPAFTIFALLIDGKIRATLAGGVAGDVFSASFISITDDEWTRISPGELLIYKLTEHLAGEGLSTLDFGRGKERYKTSWCDTEIEMFETRVPLTLKGRTFCALERAKVDFKRTVRDSETLWKVAKAVRSTLNRIR